MDDKFIEANRAHWDELAELHPDTDFYDVQGFLDGETSLLPLEREELGDVSGKSLLHLQCHFGMDTLSWAREGADVTGVDFSASAIEAARSLAAEAGLDAAFIESDLSDLPARLDREFDVVFTSYGVLYWLPDLDRWAETIDAALAPGGTFYIAEIHPFTGVFEDVDPTDGTAVFGYPYFDTGALELDAEGSYADFDAPVENTHTFEWSHSLGDVVTALLGVGLDLDFLHEHAFSCFRQFPAMEEDDEGRWSLPGLADDLPLTFSIRATKPE